MDNQQLNSSNSSFDPKEIMSLTIDGNTTNDFNWSWMQIVKVIVFGSILFLAIFGNFLAIFSFITRHRQMKSPTHYFIFNLSLADFLVGILCLPFLATQSVTGKWYFGQDFCWAYIVMHFWFCSCSIYSTCAICVERYIGVRYPLSHTKIMSRVRILLVILFIWIYGGLITFASLYIWPDKPTSVGYNDTRIIIGNSTTDETEECATLETPLLDKYECKSNQNLGHVIFSTVFILYIPALIMITLYWRIYVLATRHLKVLRSKGSGRLKWRDARNRSNNRDSTNMVSEGPATIVTVEMDSASFSKSNVEETEDLKKFEETNKPAKNLAWFPSMSRMRLPLSILVSSSGGPKVSSKESSDSTETLVQATSSKKHIYLAKRLVILVGILLLSYVPYYTVFLIRAFDPKLISIEVFNVLKWIRYFNSAINPFLYAFAVPAYRKSFINIVVRRKLFS